MSEKIGIIGLGFVGSAVRESYAAYSLVLIDNNPKAECTGTYEDLKNTSAVFVCVPSPQSADGRCDTSILESVLEKLSDYNGVIISKVTAPPSTYDALQKKYKNLVYVPEFLTAANAKMDYLTGEFGIIGGSVKAYRMEAERIVRLGQRGLREVVHCKIGEASMVKYAINCFLATKVIFMNELAELAAVNGYDWDGLSAMIRLDKRIGSSHMKVPGIDGEFGFGGMCFPKDTAALLKFAESCNVQLNVLDAAVQKNSTIRG